MKTKTRHNITFTLLLCYITARSKQYDPYGQVSEKSTGINEYDIFYGFNAEEYNPVTETQYLRSRYYTPDTGTFLSQDTVLGNVSSLNSQNRYSYAEGDPVNNADPSGHSIADSSYARNMAANGMIDEILIMEVAGTLMQNEAKANTAFSSQLYKAQAVSYQDIEAIRNISGISQATADYYIKNGGLAALKAAINLNCVPGEIVNGTIRMFETNVNAAKNSVNTQIDTVKANKTVEYNNYQAWLDEQERLLSDDIALAGFLRDKYGVASPYSNEYVLLNYKQKYIEENNLLPLLGGRVEHDSSLPMFANSSVQLAGKIFTGYGINSVSNKLASMFSTMLRQLPGGRGAVLAGALIGGGTAGIVSETSLSYLAKGVGKAAPVIGGIIDYNIQIAQGEDQLAAGVKAFFHTGINIGGGIAGAAIGSKIGLALGTVAPGPGNAIGYALGAAIGFGIGIVGSLLFDQVYDSVRGS